MWCSQSSCARRQLIAEGGVAGAMASMNGIARSGSVQCGGVWCRHVRERSPLWMGSWRLLLSATADTTTRYCELMAVISLFIRALLYCDLLTVTASMSSPTTRVLFIPSIGNAPAATLECLLLICFILNMFFFNLSTRCDYYYLHRFSFQP